MAGRRRHLIGALIGACVLGCRGDKGTSSEPPAAPRAGALPEGVAARVGAVDIAARSVARIAQSQAIDLSRARDAAVRDALFEQEARARGLDRDPAVRLALRAALARSALRDLFDEAKRVGPATDAELYDATQFYWLEMDRPVGFRTVHAVVRLDASADAARRKEASSIAAAIHKALEPIAASSSSASSAPPLSPQPSAAPGRAPLAAAEDPLAAQFKQAAASVAHDGFEVTIEALPPVAADGRVLEPGGHLFDSEFASAAAALERRGAVSPPTLTPFGVHVIMLLERTPPLSIPVEQRRARLHDEIIAARARAAQRALLDGARENAGVVLERGVDALLALVAVDR